MSRQSPGLAHAFSLLGAFVAASLVLGLLAAGLVMPVVGVAGLGAKTAVGTFDALPAEFTASPMAQQSQILAADGKVIATLYEENRTVVPIRSISPYMRQAQVAIEDARYYEHGGLDTRGIVRALLSTAQGDTQGASTITQQYIKQTLVYTALKQEDEQAAAAAQARGGIKGVVRKLQEAKYAVALEQRLSKDEILEGYLNLVYYGSGAYGVEAASKRYFGVHASQLTLPQAALIAGMPQRPTATDPFEHPKAALARRNDVLARMRSNQFISRAAYRAAVRTPIVLKPTTGQASCPASRDPYFCDYVKKWLLDQPSLGATKEEREKRIYRGGLKIQTTYDIAKNAALRKALVARVPVGNSRDVGAAAAVVEPGTGRIIALAQTTDYPTGKSDPESHSNTTVNWSVDSKYGASGGFQIGSTAKMFAVVAALEQGMSAGSYLQAPPDGTRYSAARLGGDKCGMDVSYAPFNAESDEHGGMTLEHATAKSVNTAFLELAARVGICKEAETMTRMGLHRADGEKYPTGPASVILGANNASPLTLAASYATLAAGGRYCAPYPVTKITSFDGRSYAVADGGCKQVVEPKVAYEATRILTSVLGREGTGRELGLKGGRPAAGKTGTADASVQTWFAGFTPQLSSAVWVGTPWSQRPMRGMRLAGRSYGTVYGATIAGPLWQSSMNILSEGLPVERFRMRDSQGNATKEVSVPDVTGRGPTSAERRLREAGFEVRVSENRVASDDVERGRVARTSPAAGEQAPEGTTVTIRLSDGRSRNDSGSGNGNDGGGDNANGNNGNGDNNDGNGNGNG
ncbi:penicillin-binding protein [Agilicoccus flavus]|uniref:penicillin-binding protein n=1 Tax=Agilicoccus flavus TaxID=2775968 RepID=UPI001CF62CB1|nr:transglycosylase domain-containing protein [Agilicoccus flavus]